MCLAKAYVDRASNEPILEDIAHLHIDGQRVRSETLFGEEKVISGKVREVDFSTSKIMLEQA